jgi:superfamily I DNA/RNA helicase/mRNA-degrading endonuclease RelE of RelBE toxin-antitoxin system
MEFLIADTFTDSLAKLTGDEQKAVKTTAFDLQLNPVNPGMSFHKLDRAKDKNFWSMRVSRDIRLIVHKTPGSLLLCYVDHHDRAYEWAERRKLQTHPNTGAAQLVEIRETVQDVFIPNYVETPRSVPVQQPLFRGLSDDEILGFGVPAEWLKDVRAATEESLLLVAEHLPAEAAEALLELATGGKPQVVQPVGPAANPFAHPDAQRRFRVMSDVEELERALTYPWDKWTIFLHPAQRQLVERDYSGPARVSGSAGTGKTIVALHRAVFLTRTNPDARVLLTTFSDVLANTLKIQLRRLLSNEPHLGERLEVQSINAVGLRLYKSYFGPPKLAEKKDIVECLKEASAAAGSHKFSPHFLLTEWDQVVDAWQLKTWEGYRDVSRLGRKTRLSEQQRTLLWSIFERVWVSLAERQLLTVPAVFTAVAASIGKAKNPIFNFAVVDEAQDLTVAHIRFLAALAGERPNGLFFAGDLGQRIFQQPFSWRILGVDVRGRSKNLNVNYRTSHQIRSQADRLLGPETSDADGNVETRANTVSVFNGAVPLIYASDSEKEELETVAKWIKERRQEGVLPHEIGLFVRSSTELNRARKAIEASGEVCKTLDDGAETTSGHVSVSTMHLAKGLEFRAVIVMACDDEIIPSQERIETVADESDLKDIYDTERHLLYVACTRARDQLLVTSVKPRSEFLDDLDN